MKISESEDQEPWNWHVPDELSFIELKVQTLDHCLFDVFFYLVLKIPFSSVWFHNHGQIYDLFGQT